MSDTFARSCAHWSEAGRRGMEDFYALATADYRHLAEAHDWAGWLEAQQARVGDRPLRLLDVACGSGKFPAALVAHAGVATAGIRPIAYSLLDPSAFSIAETRHNLPEPFVADREYEVTLQALDCAQGAFDVLWATHALYAVPAAELDAAMERFLHALGNIGVIAHSCTEGHYLQFQALYRRAFGEAEPYSSAEAIEASLLRLGARLQTRDIRYHTASPDSEAVEGFLQRCVFDDDVSLSQMLAHDVTGPYLQACRHEGGWRFGQKVRLIFIQSPGAPVEIPAP